MRDPAAFAALCRVAIPIALVLLVIMAAGAWKVFSKAGKPGWAALVPLYNVIVLLRITGKPLGWLAMLLIPPVFAFLVGIALAGRFSKGVGFGLGLAFLGPVFFPVLGFGGASYLGPKPPPAA
jgi:hypothetical protein